MVKERVFDFDCCPYVECWGYCILRCVMLEMWDVGIWDVGDVR